MADAVVVVGMDHSEFRRGLHKIKDDSAAASGAIGRSFSMAGAKLEGASRPFKELTRGINSVVGAGAGLAGMALSIKAGWDAATEALDAYNGKTKEMVEARENYEAAQRARIRTFAIDDPSLGEFERQRRKARDEFYDEEGKADSQIGTIARLTSSGAEARIVREREDATRKNKRLLDAQLSRIDDQQRESAMQSRVDAGRAIYEQIRADQMSMMKARERGEAEHADRVRAINRDEVGFSAELMAMEDARHTAKMRRIQQEEDAARRSAQISARSIEIELMRARGLGSQADMAERRLDTERKINEVLANEAFSESEKTALIAQIEQTARLIAMAPAKLHRLDSRTFTPGLVAGGALAQQSSVTAVQTRQEQHEQQQTQSLESIEQAVQQFLPEIMRAVRANGGGARA